MPASHHALRSVSRGSCCHQPPPAPPPPPKPPPPKPPLLPPHWLSNCLVLSKPASLPPLKPAKSGKQERGGAKKETSLPMTPNAKSSLGPLPRGSLMRRPQKRSGPRPNRRSWMEPETLDAAAASSFALGAAHRQSTCHRSGSMWAHSGQTCWDSLK